MIRQELKREDLFSSGEAWKGFLSCSVVMGTLA